MKINHGKNFQTGVTGIIAQAIFIADLQQVYQITQASLMKVKVRIHGMGKQMRIWQARILFTDGKHSGNFQGYNQTIQYNNNNSK